MCKNRAYKKIYTKIKFNVDFSSKALTEHHFQMELEF